jgi:phage terminase large subunit-like protein
MLLVWQKKSPSLWNIDMPRKADDVNLSQILLEFEKQAVNTAIAPGIGAYKPHPSQEKFHRSSSKEKLYIGGNRSGKTVGGGAEMVMWLTGEHRYRTDIPRPPIRGRVVAVDLEEGVKKITLPEIKRWMPKKYLQNGSWDDSYDKVSRTLTLTNGSFLEFMSYEQDREKFQGTSRHCIWFDEEPSEEIFDECLMRLVDTDGSYWISMTPLIEMTWVKSRIYDTWVGGDRSIYVLEVSTLENPHIKIEALDRLTRGLTEAERNTRRSGAFISHTGLVYAGSFSHLPVEEEGNVMDDILTNFPQWREMKRGFGHFAMLDHGFTNPTAILFGCFDGEGRIIIYDEIYESGNLVKENAYLFQQRVETLGINLEYVVGDPSIQNTDPITGTSIQIEYAENGVYIALGNNDVRAGITRIQGRFKNRLLFITERCTNTLKELNSYRWDRYASRKIEVRRNKKEVPLKKNDHAMDALRYGVCSRPSFPDEVDMPVGNVLGLPRAGPIEMDWALMTQNSNATPAFDDILGSEY